MEFTETAEQCGHFFIEHDIVTCEEHGAHGAWSCSQCDEEFVPCSEIDGQLMGLQALLVGIAQERDQATGRFLMAVALWIGTIIGALVL